MAASAHSRIRPPVPPPALAGFVGYLLRLAHLHADACAVAAMPEGWHPRELGVLLTLLDEGPQSQSLLAERMDVNRTLMVAIVDRLERRGLVVRERDPVDRRAYALRLTPRGESGIADVEPRLAGAQAELCALLDAAQRARLATLLRPLAARRIERLPERLRASHGFLIAKAHLHAHQASNEALAPLGVDTRDTGHLAVLDHTGPTSQRELARTLSVTSAAVVGVVDALEHAGLVERHRNPADRRAYLLHITDAGHATLERAIATIDATLSELCAPLGPGGQRELHGLLSALLGVER